MERFEIEHAKTRESLTIKGGYDIIGRTAIPISPGEAI
jgi:hypothetical protein